MEINWIPMEIFEILKDACEILCKSLVKEVYEILDESMTSYRKLKKSLSKAWNSYGN